jgi:hypothetical protein
MDIISNHRDDGNVPEKGSDECLEFPTRMFPVGLKPLIKPRKIKNDNSSKLLEPENEKLLFTKVKLPAHGGCVIIVTSGNRGSQVSKL